MNDERQIGEKFLKPYDPLSSEPSIYTKWEESGYFNPDNLPGAKDPYCIIMPPPNANGSLHVGHALFVTLQDVLIRYKRMRGYKTLWLPGADHAGFETQLVYEKKLEKEGRSRFKMSREEFYKETLAFTLENKKFMEGQLRHLGASCDWSRLKFTLDPDIVKTVYGTFEQLYRDEMIYRGARPVNWSTKYQTSLSDLETKTIERKDPLYYLKYGPFVLATVRPETKFGDTAVAVHPEDPRYKEWIGKDIEFEGLIGPIKLKVIADEYVDREFGTGVVKITPAHDPNDFEIGQRHNLPVVEVIDQFGRLNEKTGKYKGMKIMEARAAVVKDMQEKGLIEKIDEEYTHNILVNYKNENDVLEPRIIPQWYVKMAPLVALAREAVEAGTVKFVSEQYRKIFFHWLDNLRDWNISRQIVWGIPIPAWYCIKCKNVTVQAKVKSRWFILRHGETEGNVNRILQGHRDSPLTPNGRAQVEAAARTLKDQDIGLIISSDLGRCKETAGIISREIGAEIVFDPALRERSMGDAEGMTYEEKQEKFGSYLISYTEAPGNIEPSEKLESRVSEAFETHKNAHGHQNVLIVSHGSAIRMLLRRLRDVPIDEIAHMQDIRNAQPISIDILEIPCEKCGADLFEHDPDTFDTWFSSGQWPFAALGYPDGQDFKTFYPTSVMETGHDILFFWVMRMIMLGLYRTGDVPFCDVYLHGLIRDAQRQKMSKSKGNVINPLQMTETYGTDALRMALLVGNTPGMDMALSENKIKAYKLFSNKLWNIARFVLESGAPKGGELNDADIALVKEAAGIAEVVTKDIESYRLYIAAEKLYHFVWDRFAAEIIEESKPILKQAGQAADSRRLALQKILDISLRLLHPFMPFVTEAIWQELPEPASAQGSGAAKKDGDLLMVAKWPSTV